MLTYLFLFFLICCLAATLVVLFYMVSMLQSILYTRVPCVPIASAILPDILRVLDLHDNSVLYDLGCGDAKVLLAAAGQHPKARFVGVELIWWPYVSAKWRVWKSKNKQVCIVRKNFFTVPVGDSTHIFLYLFPGAMKKLLPKLLQELAPGTRVVSCAFRFFDKKEKEVIDLGGTDPVARYLYVYEF